MKCFHYSQRIVLLAVCGVTWVRASDSNADYSAGNAYRTGNELFHANGYDKSNDYADGGTQGKYVAVPFTSTGVSGNYAAAQPSTSGYGSYSNSYSNGHSQVPSSSYGYSQAADLNYRSNYYDSPYGQQHNNDGPFQPITGRNFDASQVDITHDSYGHSASGLSGGYGEAAEPHHIYHSQAQAIPVSNHIEYTKHIPYPVYKQIHVPISKPVDVKIPHPVLVPVPHPYPIHIPVAQPVAVPVVKEITIPVEKIVPYPVEKHVPYPVEKHIPYPVEQHIKVHVPHPYPVKVPIIKTIYHKVKSSSRGHGWK